MLYNIFYFSLRYLFFFSNFSCNGNLMVKFNTSKFQDNIKKNQFKKFLQKNNENKNNRFDGKIDYPVDVIRELPARKFNHKFSTRKSVFIIGDELIEDDPVDDLDDDWEFDKKLQIGKRKSEFTKFNFISLGILLVLFPFIVCYVLYRYRRIKDKSLIDDSSSADSCDHSTDNEEWNSC